MANAAASGLSTQDTNALKNAILTATPAEVVAEHVLERIPHVFSDDWLLYRSWRGKLGRALDVDPCNLCLTGSASVGFSLNPHKKLAPYGASSDIDIAIISDHHFDVAWRVLRSVRIADARTPKEKQSIKDHQTRYIYWGTIATDRIVRFFPFAKQWTIALSEMQAEKPTDGRELKFRIYKDYDALRAYQIRSVLSVRTYLLETI